MKQIITEKENKELHADLKNAIMLYKLKNPDFTSLENICKIDFIENNIKPEFIKNHSDINVEQLEYFCNMTWLNLIKDKTIDNFSRII